MDDLINRLKYFVYDLLNFNEESQERLSKYSILYPKYYFSTFYFTEDEISFLINYQIEKIIYKNIFDDLIKNKNIIRTSHDITPLICRVFKLKKNFQKDKKFIIFMKKFKGI